MVECELKDWTMMGDFVGVLIDTWWNVNVHVVNRFC